jgi:hypothetical protein
MKKLTLIILTLIIFSPSVNFFQTKDLSADEKFKISNGSVTLKAGTKATLHPNGLIKSGYLAKPLKYTMGQSGTIFFGTEKQINFTESGKIANGYLDQPATIKSIYGDFKLPKGGYIAFHPTGALYRIDLDGKQILKGMPGNGSIAIKNFIIFTPEGRPGDVDLANDQAIKSYTFKEGSVTYFHSTGHVKRGMLAKEYKQRIGKLKLKEKKWNSGEYYDFDENGEIK